MNHSKYNERIGNISKNNQGSLMEIVEYKSNKNILVKFKEYGNTVHTSWEMFNKGKVRNAYDRTIYGVGYLGEGKYSVKDGDKRTPQYSSWTQMMARCYHEKTLALQSSYSKYSVCTFWHNFQNFAKWFDDNYYDINGEKMHLDKDILIKGNKVYSPETCIFVPERINKLFEKNDASRGILPIGVSIDKNAINKKYRVNYSDSKCKYTYIGRFSTPEEAFFAYKEHKEKAIKEVANEYKDKIPSRLYDALINYQVEITD